MCRAEYVFQYLDCSKINTLLSDLFTHFDTFYDTQ